MAESSQSTSPTMAGKVAIKAREIVTEDTQRIQGLARDAIKSRSYLYPIKGIYYFLSHRSLWKPLVDKILPVASTGITVTTIMFIFTYVPQAAVLAFVNGPLAVVTTILLVLSESATLTNAISRSFFVEEALVDTFDGTLIARQQPDLVSQGRQLRPTNAAGDAISRLGKLVKKPLARFSPKALLRYVLYLPLNLIPVVGTVLFVVLQARRIGPASHTRYFQLKGYSQREKEDHIAKRKAAYTAFGIPAVLLEMIPFVGIGFAFTNTVGAALWAADLEEGAPPPKNAKEGTDLPASGQETGIVRDGHKEL